MNQGPSTDSQADSGNILLPLSDVSHLFTAPVIAPLSESPAEVLGVSGAEYLLHLLNMNKPLQRSSGLVILLPAQKAADAQAELLTRAVHRFAEFRVNKERRDLRDTYAYGSRVIGISLVLLALCLWTSALFTSEITAWMRPLTRHTFEYGFEIIGWVTMWHPIETLLFTPLPIRYRIAALRTMAALKVVIRADPAQAGTASA